MHSPWTAPRPCCVCIYKLASSSLTSTYPCRNYRSDDPRRWISLPSTGPGGDDWLRPRGSPRPSTIVFCSSTMVVEEEWIVGGIVGGIVGRIVGGIIGRIVGGRRRHGRAIERDGLQLRQLWYGLLPWAGPSYFSPSSYIVTNRNSLPFF